MKDNRGHEISVGGFNSGIFYHITSLENLFGAWKEFKKGKVNKTDVIVFSLNLENNIFELRRELLSGKWESDGYVTFSIKDPKPRNIHKASVRDRVLYQALYRILYPMFDSAFIHDLYSSRTGKGTHAGIKKLNVLLRKLSNNYTGPVYALKCDIKTFFDSVDHKILMTLVRRKIDCLRTTKLLAKIVDSFHKIQGKGLPLGNVTSQIFANIYMSPFDWHVKKELGFKHYIRYCDDFVILSSNRDELAGFVPLLQEFLIRHLKLGLHPDKVLIRKLHQGVDFLGGVILPHRIVVRTNTKKRILKNTRKILEQVESGQISKENAYQTLASYRGYLSHTKSRALSRKIVEAQILLSIRS